MKRASLLAFAILGALALPAPAGAELERTIDGARIRLADVSDGYDDGDLASLDLGPAPPPGNTRLLSRGEVEDQLRAAGDDAKKLRMPRSLRVKSASKRWTPDELRDALTPKVIAALPPGLQFRSAKLNRALVTSPSVVVGDAHIPRFPKRTGELTLTATVDLMQDGATVLRVPVTVIVMVTEQATLPAAGKGARVKLMIRTGSASVSALATALSDTELGGVGSFKVITTQRILRGRLLSPDTAEVIQ
jgi:hypothetical protein